MQEMYLIAEQEKINIKWWNFTPPILGIYWSAGEHCQVIGLDNTLETDTKLLRCVFAEELGHHFTTAEKCISTVCLNYRDRLYINRSEFKALRWAAEYLMPESKIKMAFRKGFTESWDLSEYFNVTEEMVRFRLGLENLKGVS